MEKYTLLEIKWESASDDIMQPTMFKKLFPDKNTKAEHATYASRAYNWLEVGSRHQIWSV